jgi:hypothetical protein
MTTSDTPRTDAILMECPSHLQEIALANLAQDLEQELAHSLANQLKTQAEVERLKALPHFHHESYCRKCGQSQQMISRGLDIQL